MISMGRIVLVLAALIVQGTSAEETSVASKPEDAKGLKVGDMVPQLTLKTVKGEAFDLLKAIKERPTLLVFYRGGWCPYCNAHLSQLQKIEGDLSKLGFRILAISPETPKSLSTTAEKDKLSYTLLSDTGLEAIKAFKLAFKLDEATIEKYKTYKLDLSAHDWTLPVPAAYLVGKDGKIVFAHAVPDYKQRIELDKLLEAAKAIIEKP